jgi:hypothetical protein
MQQQRFGLGLQVQQLHLLIGGVRRLPHLYPANLVIGGGRRLVVYRLGTSRDLRGGIDIIFSGVANS